MNTHHKDLNLRRSYFFELPEALIAKEPLAARDQCRLMVVDRKSGQISHRFFREALTDHSYQPGEVFVLNDSKVMKARLKGHRIGEGSGKVEFLLLEEVAPLVWEGIMRSTARQKAGLAFEIQSQGGGALRAELVECPGHYSQEVGSGTVFAKFERDPLLSGVGELPLPPYLEREVTTGDDLAYQTVYAREEGSAAAPTAGLHFTKELMDEMRVKSKVQFQSVTLHVGAGTFRPVKVDRLSDHVMHRERFEISEDVANRITEAKQRGLPITAVGTTSVRTLESAWKNGALQAGKNLRTGLFLRPDQSGFARDGFQVVDRLITNFHLPESTLLMLVCAFAGYDLTMEAYQQAVKEGYRFFSYGDAMWIV